MASTSPAIAWILVMVVVIILVAVTWMGGLLVGQLFPELESMGVAYVPVDFVLAVILVWMPLGLAFGFIVWAIAYTFIREAVVR